MTETKQIDLMESLDDIEKYKGKWRNHYIAKGIYFTGFPLYESQSMAEKAAYVFISTGNVDKNGMCQIMRNGIKITTCKPSEIIYLGAIPERE